MILLGLLGCADECHADLDGDYDWRRPAATPGTRRVCAGVAMTEIWLWCADDAPVVFQGAGMDATELRVAPGARGFHVSGCAFELRDLTITGADLSYDPECLDGDRDLEECLVHGGAVSLVGSQATFTRVRLSDNAADVGGAARLVESTLSLVDAEVRDNTHGAVSIDGASALVSIGTTWSGNEPDVVLPDGEATAPDGDFTCTPEGCE